MTGPEHYKAAEQLLAPSQRGGGVRVLPSSEDVARAQVHATLALAAATIEPVIRQGVGSDLTILTDWSEVVS